MHDRPADKSHDRRADKVSYRATYPQECDWLSI